MAEEWGEIIIKAPSVVTDLFVNGSYRDALTKLAEYAGIDSELADNTPAIVDEVEFRNSYLYLWYQCSEWVSLSTGVVSSGINIEYYAIHGDEYGTMNFFALSRDGTRFSLQFDQDGDTMVQQTRRQKTIERLSQWTTLVPEVLKQAFPDFANINRRTGDRPQLICEPRENKRLCYS